MTIRVLASVVQRNHRLLACRCPRHKRDGGLWEFPGGKVKDGESDLERRGDSRPDSQPVS